LGILLEVVTVLSSTFAYIQEGQASSAMDNFKKMLPTYTDGIV
jgi:hypothetical protein